MDNITSRENSFIKQYIKLKTSKATREEQGLFVIEGVKVCLEAFFGNISIERIFVTERVLNKNDKIKDAILNRENVYVITSALEQKLSDTKTPQGIFCVCRWLDKKISFNTIDNGRLFVMLCGIQDPGNLGTIIRTADGLGVDGVILTEDCCDIYNPKVVRSTMGSLARMNILTIQSETDFLLSLSPKVKKVASVVDETALPPDCIDTKNSPCVILIGNEGNGLSDKTVSLCDIKTMIPMSGGSESFNASVAAGILMWELLK